MHLAKHLCKVFRYLKIKLNDDEDDDDDDDDDSLSYAGSSMTC